MAFIWNDKEMKFVIPGEDWDERQYVIMRKLFIQLEKGDYNEVEEADFKEEVLHTRFKKYGPIENITISISDDGMYGYVQFFDSKDAYIALHDQKLQPQEHSKYLIHPADTWHQPRALILPEVDTNTHENMEVESADITINQLNEDCLIRIFEFCDEISLVNLSEVCTQFNDILHGIVFPKHKTCILVIEGYRKFYNEVCVNLALMRRYLHCYGPYLTNVRLCFGGECEREHRKPQNICRIFNKFAQLIGPNLRQLDLHELVLQADYLNALKPVLSRLNILKIITLTDQHFSDIDFIRLCPNLKKFSFNGRMDFVHCAERWPTLEMLKITFNSDMEIETTRLLMQNNPQLKHLTISTYNCDTLMQNMERYLKNLEKLTLYDDFDSDLATISETTLQYLTNFKNLHTLKLMFLRDSQFNSILSFLPKITGLQKIKLHCNDDTPSPVADHQLVIALAIELVELKVFHIAFVRISEDIIIDFIRHAKKLEEFCMHNVYVSWNVKLINNIVNVRKHSKSTQPLQIIDVDINVNSDVDTDVDYDTNEIMEDEKLWLLLKTPDIQKYVRVKKCNHSSLNYQIHD